MWDTRAAGIGPKQESLNSGEKIGSWGARRRIKCFCSGNVRLETVVPVYVRSWSGDGMGCRVSIWFEMPIGFRCTGLNIAMAKGNLNTDRGKPLLVDTNLTFAEVLLVFGFVLYGGFFFF